MKQVITPLVQLTLREAPQALDTQRLRYAVRRDLTQWAMTVLLTEDGSCLPMEGFEAEIARVVCQLDTIQGPTDAANVISEVFCLSFGPTDGFLPDQCQDIGRKVYATLLQWNAGRAAEPLAMSA